VLGWATGNLAEPRNNPQVGMANMRGILPALQKARPANLAANGLRYLSLSLPKAQRTTRLVKDSSPKAIAGELLAWLQEE
jgi:electron transfer flavoprotein beta subunit